MTFIKGKEQIRLFKNKAGSTFCSTYTRCCHTCLITATGPGYSHHGISVPINAESLSPSIRPQCRVNCVDAINKDKLPLDAVPNYDYGMGSWDMFGNVAKSRLIGIGSMLGNIGKSPLVSTRRATPALKEGGKSKGGDKGPLVGILSTDAAHVTEIAGKEAYDAKGFQNILGLVPGEDNGWFGIGAAAKIEQKNTQKTKAQKKGQTQSSTLMDYWPSSVPVGVDISIGFRYKSDLPPYMA